MAIKIIKEGKTTKFTKFTKTCPDCKCEFEYEQDDVKVDHSCCLTTYPPKYNTYIVCPCCMKHLHHGYTTPAISSYPNITYTTTATSWPDCDTCQFKPDPNKVVVGDTPCTWCKKNQPYCISNTKCTSASTSYTVNPKDFNVSTYTTSSYTSPDFTANYTTTPELNKQAAYEYTIDAKE